MTQCGGQEQKTEAAGEHSQDGLEVVQFHLTDTTQ